MIHGTREGEKWGRLGNTYDMMTSGGREVDVGGRCPITSTGAINLKATLVPTCVSLTTLAIKMLRSDGRPAEKHLLKHNNLPHTHNKVT